MILALAGTAMVWGTAGALLTHQWGYVVLWSAGAGIIVSEYTMPLISGLLRPAS